MGRVTCCSVAPVAAVTAAMAANVMMRAPMTGLVQTNTPQGVGGIELRATAEFTV